jgi:TonB family protein
MRRSNIVVTSALLVGSGAVHAQYRCDCTSVVDTCTAEVVARGTFLEIKTNRPQCARVDYFVDGQPFVSMVVDGEDRENWLARTTNPRILVQSCQVCRENGPGATATAARIPVDAENSASAAAEAEAGLQPLIASVPEYPATAQARGLRGRVEVEFTVTPAGTVENPRVVSAEPRGIFDAAALAAVARRRYPEDTAREPQTLSERIEFAPPRAAARPPATLASSGPLNQCLREEAVYNYGEMVDVSLINACPQPLAVFGCAHGTGKDAGRWVCSSSEQRGVVLAPSADARIGRRVASDDAADARTYEYSASYSLTRAPNSRYWWIGCAASDAECRSDARLWTRSVDGQDASLNPETRSAIAVSSSD